MTATWIPRLIALLVAQVVVLGQTGRIAGIIVDSSGGRVPDSSLTARNVDTGVERRTTSNREGYYSLPLLLPGRYEMTVLKDGFRAISRGGIRLRVDETARIDFVLEVGEVTTSISIVVDTPLITTDSGTLKQVLDQRRIVSLPLNSRNSEELLFLAAGAVRDTRTRSAYVSGSAVIPDTVTPAINGARSNGVAYRLDGVNNNDNYTGVSSPFPNPDALDEFTVHTNSFSAEFGDAPGGLVNIRTRSGTNATHGTAFEFVRNGAVNARNFFASSNDTLKRNQFGGTIGGPILRDRAFYFGSYEGTRIRSRPGGLSQVTLTDAMRSGDFSAFTTSLSDPFSNAPLPGNQIPVSRMDPVSVKLLRYMPRASDPSGRVWYSLLTRTDYNELLLKTDQSWHKHRLYERYFEYDLNTPAIFPNPHTLTQLSDGRAISVKTLAFNDVYAATPTLLGHVALTYADTYSRSKPVAPFGVADLGAKVAQPAVPSLSVNISGYSSFYTTHLARLSRDNYEINNAWIWIHGKHQIQFGGAVTNVQQDTFNDFRKNAGFSFTSDVTGNAAASFLLGNAGSFVQGGGEYKGLRGWRLNGYVQDSHRIWPSFAIMAGLRLDPWLPYTDKHGRITCIIAGAHSQRYPNAPTNMLFAGDSECPSGGAPAQVWNWSPRLGFAWNPRRHLHWSVRGGYGIFFEQPETILYNRFVDTAPFSPTVMLSEVQFSDPYRGRVDPFPASYGPRVPPSSEPFDSPVLATTLDQKFSPAYMQNWNLSVERQLGRHTLTRVAYAGSKGTHLRLQMEENPALYQPGATVAGTQQRRSNPQFSSIIETRAAGNSSYHSLQASIEKRFNRGFSGVANYTWSKSIDTNSVNNTQSASDMANPFNRDANRGASDFDVPHRLVASAVYELPQLPSHGTLLRAVAARWQLAGVWNWQSGFPFSVLSGVDNARSGIGQDRADFVGRGSPALSPGRPLQDVLNKYFEVAAFAPNALGTFGSSGRNILRGPGSFQIDLGAQKSFPVAETVDLQFRAEFFNLTNTPSFAQPDATLSSPSVGRILSAGDPRILQFALKAVF